MNTHPQGAPDMDALRETIAANIAAELKRNRWSGRQAAAALGFTQPYLARRLSGAVEFSGTEIGIIAGFLNTPVSDFYRPRPDAAVTHLDTGRNAQRADNRPSDYMAEILPFPAA